jgi:hypothetical protein
VEKAAAIRVGCRKLPDLTNALQAKGVAVVSAVATAAAILTCTIVPLVMKCNDDE